MTRLIKFEPARLEEKQRDLYERVSSGKRASGKQHFKLMDENGCLNGPFNAFLLSPEIGGALSSLGEAIRYRSELQDRVREIAILVVAEEFKSEFEWYAHSTVALSLGIEGHLLDEIKVGNIPEFEDKNEKLLYIFSTQILKKRTVDNNMYENAVDAIGEKGVLELTALLGYYSTLALIMNVFKIGLPDDQQPVFS